jgi:hypothetical protein
MIGSTLSVRVSCALDTGSNEIVALGSVRPKSDGERSAFCVINPAFRWATHGNSHQFVAEKKAVVPHTFSKGLVQRRPREQHSGFRINFLNRQLTCAFYIVFRQRNLLRFVGAASGNRRHR